MLRVAVLLLCLSLCAHAQYIDQTTTVGTVAALSRASGEGLTSHIAGYDRSFMIEARNASSAISVGGDSFVVSFAGPASITALVVDNGNGTYTATYTSYTPGTYELAVTLQGPRPSLSALSWPASGTNYVRVAASSAFQSAQVMYSAWFKTSVGSNNFLLRWASNGWGVRLFDNYLECIFFVQVHGLQRLQSPTASYADSTWHHVACGYNGQTMSLYVDGGLINSRALAATLNYGSPSELTIGASTGALVYQGLMDDVRVWNRTLNQKELQFSMEIGANANDVGLVAAWAMDEQSGSIAVDVTGKHNGTHVGSLTYVQDTPSSLFDSRKHIQGSPFTVEVSAEPSSVTGLPLSTTQPSMNKELVLQSTGRAGTNLTSGGQLYSAVFGAAKHVSTDVVGSVADLLDGRYRIVFNATQRAVYNAAIGREGPLVNRFSLALDGVNDYVYLGYPAAVTNNVFTLETWFKSSVNGTGTIFRWLEKGYWLQLINGQVKCSIFDVLGAQYSVTSPASTLYTDGAWHHTACTFNGITLRLLVQGQAVASLATTTTISFLANAGASIGRQMTNSDPQYFNGQLDELRIWNTVASDAVLQARVSRIVLPTESNLVAFFSFDEGSGSAAQDTTSSSIRGELRNGASFSADAPALFVLANPPGVAGSPYRVVVNYPTNGSLSYASGNGLNSSSAGSVSTFSIQAVDTYAVPRDSGDMNGVADVFSVRIVSNGSGKEVSGKVVNVGNTGVHTAEYNVTESGVHAVHVNYVNGNSSLLGSPYTLVVSAGAVDVQTCLLSGAGLAGGVAGVPLRIDVQSRDSFGNNRTGNMDVFGAQFNGSTAGVSVQSLGMGQYQIVANLTQSGTYSLAVRVNGGATRTVDGLIVAAAQADATTSTVVDGTLNTVGVAGQAYVVDVQSRDVFGNLRTSPVADVSRFSVALGNVAGVLSHGTVPGVVRASINMTVAGVYALSIKVDNVDVPGSPRSNISIVAAPVSLANSKAYGFGTYVAGIEGSYTVQLRDAFGNNATGTGTSGVLVELRLGNENAGAVVVAVNGKTTLAGVFNGTRSGVYAASVRLDGVSVSTAVSAVTVQPGAVAYAASSAYGVALREVSVSAVADEIYVQAKDAFGNNRTVGGDAFTGMLQGESQGTVSVNVTFSYSGAQGIYRGVFNVTQVGNYSLSVRGVSGVEILGSPFATRVIAGAPYAPLSSTATVANTVAGQGASFTVQLRDLFGNLVSQAYTLQIDANDAVSTTASQQFLGAGQQAAVLNVTLAGTYAVRVAYGNVHVVGSPFSLTVAPQASTSGALVSAFGPVLERDVVAGVQTQLFLQERDAFGNNRTSVSALERFSITLSGASTSASANLSVHAAGLGQQVYAVQATVAGTYDVAVRFDGVVIQQGASLAMRVVAAELNPSKTTFSGALLTSAVAGNNDTVVVQTRDAFGNNRSSSNDPMSFSLVQVNSNATLAAQVAYVGGGRFSAQFGATVAGSYVLTVLYNSSSVQSNGFGSNAEAAEMFENSPTVSTLCGVQAGANAWSSFGDTSGRVLRSKAQPAGPHTLSFYWLRGSNPNDNACNTPEAPEKLELQIALGPTFDTWTTVDELLHSGPATFTANTVTLSPTTEWKFRFYQSLFSFTISDAFAVDTLSLQYGPFPVSGSPATVQVSAASGFGPNSVSSGETAGTFSAGTAHSIVTRVFDRFNNMQTSGQEVLQVLVNGVVQGTAAYVANNTYVSTYNVTQAGANAVSVVINGAHVAGSPFAVNVVPGAVSAQSQVIVGQGGAMIAGEANVVRVTPADVFGNIVNVSSAVFDVSVSSGPGASSLQLRSDNVSYVLNATVAGTYTVQASLGGVALQGSPLSVQVQAAATFASASVVYGAGLAGARAGEVAQLRVQTRDVFGNNRTVGNDVVSGSVAGAQTLAMAVTYSSTEMQYVLSYNATVAGTYSLGVRVSGLEVHNATASVVHSPNVGGELSRLLVAPLTSTVAGQGVSGAIQLYDVFGNVIGGASGYTSPFVSGVTSYTDSGQGVINVTIVLTAAGVYAMPVQVNGKSFVGSPLALTVVPDVVSAVNSTATGALVNAVAGFVAQVNVTMRDRFGNQRLGTGDVPTVSWSNPSVVAQNEVNAVGNGVYMVLYNITVLGENVLRVRVGGLDIDGSPFTVTIVAATTTVASTSRVLGGSIAGTVAGQQTSFVVQARDSFGNNATSTDDVFTVQFTVAATSATTLRNATYTGLPGHYRVSFSTTVASSVTAAISLNDNPVLGSPYTFAVLPDAVVASNSPFALASISTRAGELALVSVTSRDQFNNTRDVTTMAADVFTVQVGASGAALELQRSASAAGVYSRNVNLTQVGDYALIARVQGGAQVANSPQVLRVTPAAVSALTSDANGAGLTASNLNSAATFQIQARDAFGNFLSAGGDSFSARVQNELTGVSFAVSVQDNGNGKYTATYTPTVGGSYNVSVLVNNVTLAAFVQPLLMTVTVGQQVPVSSVRLVSDKTALLVAFSQDTNRAGLTGVGSCGGVFASVAAFGTSPQCVFVDARTLWVLLGTGHTVAIGSTVSFAEGGVRLASAPTASLLGVSATVALPSPPNGMAVRIVAPARVGPCDNTVQVQAVVENEAAVRFYWSVDGSEVQASTSDVLVVNTGALTTGSHTLSLRVLNVYGYNSTVATHTLTKTSGDVVRVSALGGGTKRLVARSQGLSVSVAASQPACALAAVNGSSSAAGGLSFAWTQVGSSGNRTLTLDAVTRTTSSLWLGSNLWHSVGEWYVLRVSVWSSADASVNATLDFNVTVVADESFAFVDGGDRVVSRSQAVVLDGSKSVGSTFVWSCATCGVLLNTTSNEVTKTIAANTLAAGSTHEVVLTVDGRATSRVQLQVVAATVPQVSVSRRSARVLAHERVVLEASANEVVTWNWVSLSSALDMSSTGLFSSGTSNAALVINANQLAVGRTYVLQAIATNGNFVSGYANVTLMVEVAPLSGTHTVSWDAAAGRVKMQSLAWVGTTLQYAYGYVLSGGVEVPLSERTAVAGGSFVVPAEATHMSAYVYDATTGARSRSLVSIGFNISSVSSTSSSTVSALARVGDCRGAVEVALALASSWNAGGLGNSTLAARQSERASVVEALASACLGVTRADFAQGLTANARLISLLLARSSEIQVNSSSVAVEALWKLTQNLDSSTRAQADLDAMVAVMQAADAAAGRSDWDAAGATTAAVAHQRLLVVANDVLALLSSRQACGESPSNIVGSAVSVSSQRALRNQVSASTRAVGASAQFTLPASVLDQLTSQPTCLDSQMAVWAANPYQWVAGVSSTGISGNVSDLTLRGLDGTALDISSLLNPVQIRFSGLSGANTSTASCEFWNTNTQAWSKSGCTTGSTSSDAVVCECNHLTAFAVRLTPSAEGAVKFDDLRGLTLPVFGGCEEETWSVPTMTIVGMFAVHVLAAFVLWMRSSNNVVVPEAVQERKGAKKSGPMAGGARGGGVSLWQEYRMAWRYHHMVFSVLRSSQARVGDMFTELQREHRLVVAVFVIMAAETFMFNEDALSSFSVSSAFKSACFGVAASWLFTLLLVKRKRSPTPEVQEEEHQRDRSWVLLMSRPWFPFYMRELALFLAYLCMGVSAFMVMWYSRCWNESMSLTGWFANVWAAFLVSILVYEPIMIGFITAWRRVWRSLEEEHERERQLRGTNADDEAADEAEAGRAGGKRKLHLFGNTFNATALPTMHIVGPEDKEEESVGASRGMRSDKMEALESEHKQSQGAIPAIPALGGEVEEVPVPGEDEEDEAEGLRESQPAPVEDDEEGDAAEGEHTGLVVEEPEAQPEHPVGEEADMVAPRPVLDPLRSRGDLVEEQGSINVHGQRPLGKQPSEDDGHSDASGDDERVGALEGVPQVVAAPEELHGEKNKSDDNETPEPEPQPTESSEEIQARLIAAADKALSTEHVTSVLAQAVDTHVDVDALWSQEDEWESPAGTTLFG